MGHYFVAQGPGKALKVVAGLNEAIGGDAITSVEKGIEMGLASAKAYESMLSDMEKEGVFAVHASMVALGSIARGLERISIRHIYNRWNVERVRDLTEEVLNDLRQAP